MEHYIFEKMDKRLIILIMFCILFLAAKAQPIKRNLLTATDKLETENDFVWRGDTIDFTEFLNQIAIEKDFITAKSAVISEGYMVIGDDTLRPLNSQNGQVFVFNNGVWDSQDAPGGYDSLVFNLETGSIEDWRGGDVFKSYPIDGRYAIIDSLSNKVKTDMLIVGSDTITGFGGGNITQADSTVKYITPTQLTDSLINTKMTIIGKKNYSIRLPSSGSVQGRITAATQGVDYPSEWSLAPGINAIDLRIEHGLGQRVIDVQVFTISGTIEQLLRPFAGAYSGFSTLDENTLLINGLATTPTAIKIYIIFE
jgi:hypothetical protein